MRAQRLLPARLSAALAFASILFTGTAKHAFGQAYPSVYVQDVDWTSGMRFITVPQHIYSPGDGNQPASTTAEAHTEFVSATEIHLTPGFHAGNLTGEGRFRAYINQGLGLPDDVVVIAPGPTHAIDDVLYVEKWEKLEIGYRLSQEYEDAIDRFFAHYYPYPETDPDDGNVGVPGNVDELHDLNPYADDSLQLVMTLTDPDGEPRMKWGFYMREAQWDPTAPEPGLAQLRHHEAHPLDEYRIRFRFAPDKVGPWQFSLSIKAPLTSTLADVPLPDIMLNGYSFICELPQHPHLNGYLQVNENNRRVLQFAGDEVEDDETPFFGLGTNMADVRHNEDFDGAWDQFFQCDFDNMKEAMEQLHGSGGNFVRMYLMRNLFAPEWVNLGVYDAYREPATCDNGPPSGRTGNCQYQSWAFDQLLDHAHANDIYIQLCIDPYPPIIAYEDIIWAGHAYSLNYLEPNRNEVTGRFDLEEFFYTPGDDPLNEGVFYYWKRKYKYIMSRWGYSVNLPIIEPFNEIDQMLTYRYADLSETAGKCDENQLEWLEDGELPETFDSWLTDIIQYVRGAPNFNDPVTSPLGDNKLFLVSFTQGQEYDTPDEDHYLPFRNEDVDLIDVHKGFHPDIQGPGNETDPTRVEHRMHEGFSSAKNFWENYPEVSADLEERKPFSHGEFNYYTTFEIPNLQDPDNPIWKSDVEKIFMNYDISFHNELWSAVFSGKFAAGTSWHWERVFWWEDALVMPPPDADNPFFHPTSGTQFSNEPGEENQLFITGLSIPVKNQTLHHHFRPLADFLSRPSVQELGILDGNYTTEAVFDENAVSPDPIECYYLTNTEHNTAIGWVHNRNASVTKSFYALSGVGNENFLGCMAPTEQYVDLPGFVSGQDYYIYWLPTRLNVAPEDLPADHSDVSGDGTVRLDLSSNPLGGVLNNYLDTLHADYAFIISPAPIVKSLPHMEVPAPVQPSWDFTLYPNPTRDEFFIRLPDDAPKEIALYDPSGRRLNTWGSVTAMLHRLSVEGLSKGIYWIRVSDGVHSRTKKLLVH